MSERKKLNKHKTAICNGSVKKTTATSKLNNFTVSLWGMRKEVLYPISIAIEVFCNNRLIDGLKLILQFLNLY